VLSAVSIDHFSPRTPASKEEFAERLRRYERATEDLRGLTVLLVTWGGNDHRPIIEKVIARLGEANIGLEGQVLWLRLATYPLLLLTYSAGIAAVASGNYSNLATVLFTPVPAGTVRERQEPSLVHVVEEFLEIERMSAFKGLPGFEKRYVPRSDYLFGMLQPPLEDLLFLGSSYENLFDRCEMILALVFADFLKEKRGRVWGPPGRFAWKQYHTEPSPLSTLIAEAERDGREWPPLVAGLFGGSVERFSSLARDYMGFIAKLGWF
jgi:hypothetical protein